MLVQLSNSARRKHGHSHVLLLWLMHSGGEITDSSPQMQLCSLVNVCEVSLMIIYKLLFGIIAARYHAFSSSEWSTSVNETYTNKKICMWLIPIAEAASKQLSITVSHKEIAIESIKFIHDLIDFQDCYENQRRLGIKGNFMNELISRIRYTFSCN